MTSRSTRRVAAYRALIFFVCLLLCAGTANAQQVDSFEQVERLAAEAGRAYQVASELQSRAPAGKLSRGADIKYEEAVALWRAAYELYPDPGLAYNLGNALLRLREFDRARARYTECAENPKAADRLKKRALEKIETANAEEASRDERRKAYLAKQAARRAKTRPVVSQPQEQQEPDSVDRSTIVVVTDAKSPVKTLSGTQLRAIYRGEAIWIGGERVIAYNRTRKDRIRRQFDESVLGMSTDEVESFWKDQQVRGVAGRPGELARSGLLLTVIATVENTIAYVYAGEETAKDNIRVVARIKGGKVLAP
jgi:tetratricopeptide (TPR) repeat protein